MPTEYVVIVCGGMLGIIILTAIYLVKIRRRYRELSSELPVLTYIGGNFGWCLSHRDVFLGAWKEKPTNLAVRNFLTKRGLSSNFVVEFGVELKAEA